MEMNRDYLYHCNGCHKADKEYPDKEIWSNEMEGWYLPRCKPLEYHMWARSDAYGIYTGLYCDKCYKDSNIYTYRKDEYFDPAYAGERMEDED